MVKLYNWLIKNENKIVIPSIQREFVWDKIKIENLFDSIYKGFFIGMFWTWDVKSELDKLECFKIPKNYSEDYKLEKFLPLPNKPIAIIDGQQRLTSLLIGTSGKYKNQILCINLKHKRRNPNNNEPIFKFQSPTQIGNCDHWYPIEAIMHNPKGKSLNPIAKIFKERLTNLELIRHNISQKDLTSVLEIFRRVNKGGKALTNTQDLLSRLALEWPKVREEFDQLHKYIKSEYQLTISYDVMVKACLFCLHKPMKIKITFDNKDNKTITAIQNNWKNVRQAIQKMAHQINNIGFSDENIPSYNALIPLIYATYKRSLGSKDVLAQYIYRSCLLRKFGRSSDSVLEEARSIMGTTGDLRKLTNYYKAERENIEQILKYEKSKYTKLALKLLYGHNEHNWHDDHIHPHKIIKSDKSFKKRLRLPVENNNEKEIQKALKSYEKWKKIWNQLPNLQALPGLDNSNKSGKPLLSWVETEDGKFLL